MTELQMNDQAVQIEGPVGPSEVLVVCEHASNHFPQCFGTLGLSAAEQNSHAAWDPGALELARSLAKSLNAPLVAAGFSRLLYDCNRPPEAPDAITEQSELIKVPGNIGLSQSQRQARIDAIYTPFCAAMDAAITAAKPQAIITMHSFTPVYHGKARSVEVGILHDSDTRLADAILAQSAGAPFQMRRNAPYGPADGVTHSLNLHAGRRGLLNVMIEIRSDLVTDAQGLETMSEFLNNVVGSALDACAAATRKAV